MRSRSVRHAGRCIGLVIAVGAPAVASAQDARVSMIASAGASVETNPYNAANTSGAEIAATAELRPMISVKDERTTAQIRGLAQFRQFLRRYGLEDNYGVEAEVVSRRSDFLTLRGTGVFSYTEGGFSVYGRPGLSVGDVTTPPQDVSLQNPPTTLTDVNVLGQRTRITSLDTVLGADARLSAYSQLSIDLEGRTMRFKTFAYNDYNMLRGELRYKHALDELVSIGIVGSYGRTDYVDGRQGDAGTTSVLASVERRFGSSWSLAAAAGASFTDIDARSGRPGVNFTSFAARLQFCRQGEYSRFCLGGQRSPQPAADGNVRVSDSITADYSLRLSDRDRFSLSGAYARTGRARDVVAGAPAISFASGSVRYDNDIGKTISAFATASASKIYSPISPRRANLGAAIGLQVRLGSPK